MPRSNVPWDDISQQGNPTKLTAVNKVIEMLKKHDVRGTGVITSAHRAIDSEEYISVLLATRLMFVGNKEY